LRSGDHRVTASRRTVWAILSGDRRHRTAQEILDGATALDPSINLSSIYRTLALFSELGLVRETKLGNDASSHWEITHPDDAIHLVCIGCRTVTHHAGEFVERLREHLDEHHGFLPHSTDVTVSGLCPHCRDASDQPVNPSS